MEDNLFIKGLLIGVAIAAPVGPIGVLCIRRTLTQGWLSGLLSGLGAASADLVYGAIAGFGLTIISQAILRYQTTLQWVGGLFLLYIGVRAMLSRPQAAAQPARRRGLVGDYTSTFILTLSNPVTILAFGAVFTSFGLAGQTRDWLSASALVGGVFSGSAIWWLSLSGAVSWLRNRITAAALLWINRISGLVIVIFGLVTLANALA